MDPVAAGRLETPVMRPLVVVSALPFQITAVESTNPRFRCDLPAGGVPATIHRLPVVFLGGDTPGKLDTRIRIQTTASAEPLEAEVSINLTQPVVRKRRPTKARPKASRSRASRTERAVDPVFGPPGTASKPRSSPAGVFDQRRVH